LNEAETDLKDVQVAAAGTIYKRALTTLNDAAAKHKYGLWPESSETNAETHATCCFPNKAMFFNRI
jgi:hypothetical protein